MKMQHDRDPAVTAPRLRGLFPLLMLVLVGLAVIVPGLAGGSSSAAPGALPAPLVERMEAPRPGIAGVGPLEPGPSGPQQVVVGFYVNNLQDLDQENSSYYVDFFLWLRWTGDNDPSATIELTNNIERWGLTQNPVYEEPKTLEDGQKVQAFRIQGRFFEPFDLAAYPLDQQHLTLTVEDIASPSTAVQYVADTEQSGVDASARVPGWTITDDRVTTGLHTYETDFGEPGLTPDDATYSTASLTITIDRPDTFFVFKLLLPLVIVLLLAGSVLLTHPSLVEVRLAAPGTALLTLVFLQQAYSSTLPEIGQLVLLDKIYAVAYSLVIVLIATVILTSHWTKGDPDPATVARARRLDRAAAAGAALVFVGATVVLLVLR